MGELFAGIGGFSLGFQRAGYEVAWQVEIEPYCRNVLKKNFPNVKRYKDVRKCGAHNLDPVDVICGGFPCQDISCAGKRVGIEGERSGLWTEFARIISELRPQYAVVENVSALLGRGIGRVLGDLAEIGYDAEWQIISAADVGAPHLRERVWIMAYPQILSDDRTGCAVLSNAAGWRKQSSRSQCDEWRFQNKTLRSVEYPHDWKTEPDVDRVADGIPSRMDRLRALGNAVVPQIPEWIAKQIILISEEQRSSCP